MPERTVVVAAHNLDIGALADGVAPDDEPPLAARLGRGEQVGAERRVAGHAVLCRIEAVRENGDELVVRHHLFVRIQRHTGEEQKVLLASGKHGVTALHVVAFIVCERENVVAAVEVDPELHRVTRGEFTGRVRVWDKVRDIFGREGMPRGDGDGDAERARTGK